MELTGKIRDLHFPTCPIRNIISRVCEKWPMLILLNLEEKGDWMRFKDLLSAIPDISQKMLTQHLRILETDGLVERQVYAEVPPRVEYRLTSRAYTLTPLLNHLVEWGANNLSDILKDRERNTQDE